MVSNVTANKIQKSGYPFDQVDLFSYESVLERRLGEEINTWNSLILN